MKKPWRNTFYSVFMMALLTTGCTPTMNSISRGVGGHSAGASVERVLDTSYLEQSHTVAIHAFPASRQTGEDVIDVSDPQSIINYATARYPNRVVNRVQLLHKKSISTSDMVAQNTVSGQYVEALHGWVSYHVEPRLKSAVLGSLSMGQKAPLITKLNSFWYEIQVNNQRVFITTNANYTRLVQGVNHSTDSVTNIYVPVPARQPSPTPAIQTTSDASISIPPPGVRIDPNLMPIAAISAPIIQKRNAVLQVARSKLNTPYVWGHNEDRGQYGFDCSNFAQYVYHHALGYLFTTSSRQQYASVGVPIATSQMQPGDLLIFNSGSHVGIYAGNGQMIEEGGGLGKVGYLKVTPGSYWGNHISTVKRMF